MTADGTLQYLGCCVDWHPTGDWIEYVWHTDGTLMVPNTRGSPTDLCEHRMCWPVSLGGDTTSST